MNGFAAEPDWQEVLEHSVEAAKLAGKILVRNFGKIAAADIENKSDFDFVTKVDREAEAQIIDYLARFYPDFSVHAEESGEDSRASAFQWLIDPLDGTKNYIHSFPVFCVSIALKYRGQIQTGVIYAPMFDELFTAVRGGGAFLNGKKIRVSATTRMPDAMLATGFPHAAKRYLDVYLQTFRELFLRVSAIRRAGSAALDLAYTACGRFEGFWEFKLNPWDLGAGILLVEEAGGLVTDPAGGSRHLETGDLIAASRAIHRRMLEVIRPICEGKLG